MNQLRQAGEGVGGAIDCVPHARPSRRRYLRMVGFRVFDYVYKHVRPYIVFVPGLTMYKHLRTFWWRGFTMGTILRATEVASTFQSICRLSLSLLLVL